MSVASRRESIISLLMQSDTPLSGTYLSKTLGVSRQIIVQDMNSLKADDYDIISTPRGYILNPAKKAERIFKVYHSIDDTEKELNLIVDLGAEIKDVFIYHRVYNEIHAKLNIRSRRDVTAFCNDIRSGKSSPLMTVTGGYHYHTIVAPDMETLNLVEKALHDNNFLAELTDYEPTQLVKNL